MTIDFREQDIAPPQHSHVNQSTFLPELEAPFIPAFEINHWAKRLFDVVSSMILLIILSPVFLVLSLAIKLDGGPAFFRHKRVGQGGNTFRCLKFRSMSVTAERDLAAYLRANHAAAVEWATQRKLRDDPRITPLGKFLRSTSLDELPQLFNVLRGEMSLIGPRPVVRAEFDKHYNAAGQVAYAAARPGITGLWQVSGRSGTSYAERVRLDIVYVNYWSLRQDFRILARTIPAVLRRKGAI